MAENPTPSHGKGIAGFLGDSTAGLPNWAWLLVIGVGVTAAIVVPKLFQGGAASSPATTGGASGLGLAIDPTTGLPYAVEGLAPSGGGTVTSSGPPPLPTATANTGSSIFVRSQFSQPGVKDYDTANTGIPIRSAPNITSGTLKTVPFGSQIQLSGGAITGTGNIDPTNPSAGSDIWYPVVGGGYISQFDIGNVGSTGPRHTLTWPANFTRSRHYRIA